MNSKSIDDFMIGRMLADQFSEQDWAGLSDSDWQLVFQKAHNEGVAPLLFWKFSHSGQISALPAEVHSALRLDYFTTWQQNQRLLDELGKLSGVFSQARIPFVVLKGACFILTIYPDIGLRPLADLDLLVPGARHAEAARIAQELGYKTTYPEAFPGLSDLLGHDVHLEREGLVLELHHSLIAERTFLYAVPVDWFWSQTEPLEFKNNVPMLMLTPTTQALYAAAHAMLQHGAQQAPMRWFYDIDRLVRTYPDRLNWDVLLGQARAFEWDSALSAALLRAEALFGTPLPDPVRKDLLASTDRHRVLVDQKRQQPATHTLGEFQKLRSLNWHGRIILFLALVIPTPAYMRWRYGLVNTRSLPGAYLRRWWGILKDGWRTVLILFRQRSSHG